MLGRNPSTCYQISNYYSTKVIRRKNHIRETCAMIAKIAQDILHDVERQEPRFISTIIENQQGRYEGIIAHSPDEFEILLYLNQMGVFSFVDDGTIPGCAVLKLSDGRKRSMSLWVEFITASGYLSARKIRSRFQALVGQAIEKSQYSESCELIKDTSDVKIKIQDKYILQITCAFRCNSIWPRSATHWPNINLIWPSPQIANEVKSEGFDLLSKETIVHGGPGIMLNNISQNEPPLPIPGSKGGNTVLSATTTSQNNSTMEGDAWAMNLTHAESILISHPTRKKTLSILKSLRDDHLQFPNSPITNYIIKTLILFECEKHPHDYEWKEHCIGDRILGVLLQLVSCLQCRKCPHYFIPQLDLLKGKPYQLLDESAKVTWKLARTLMLDARALESL
ncbi:Protein mab-21-like 1 [Strongyloides ratti]|uniref:Protein mab-21-like 1 n=1 Tax=Strongyloides ratti TaxID=34506 RepID=A0A090LBJ0_STRRB|nr:Protein mab-21-like 1 [Strongyloides ratti]CEF65498.1 Protein mab-21-like 1 [Strongyloides ratti]